MIKIATWNVESVRRLSADRKAAFYEAMEQQNADLWVLTETWVESSLKPFSNYTLAAQSEYAEDLASSPERCWVSIWVRNDMEHTRVEFQLQQDRMAGVRVEIPDHPPVVVVGTVLPWFSDKLWPGADGFCAAVAEQSSEWTRVQRQQDDCIFLVAGDFNQSLPWVSRYGSEGGELVLSAALRHHDLLCLTSGQEKMTGKPRIDHICITWRSLQSPYLPLVSEWAVPLVNGKRITDHVGIAAEFPVLTFPSPVAK
jgi:hypothetical protein